MTGRQLALVLLVLGSAAVLRGHGLSRWSLDGDELYSYYDVVRLQGGELSPGVRSYPLGYLLMASSAALFGPAELGLRAAPALCGFLAVAALLLLRRDAVPFPVAVVAAALAALSPWLVYHAQEARFYAPLLLFATLATLWALPGPEQRPLLALFVGVLAAACHPCALLLLPCLAGPPLARRLPGRAVLLVCLLAAAAGATWLLVGDGSLPRLVQGALARRALARYDLVHFVAGLGYALGPAALLLTAAGAWVAWRKPQPGDRLLLACGLLPPLLLLLVSALAGAAQQRYAMASVPALLLLAGRGFQGLLTRRGLSGALLAAALLLPAPQLLAHARDGDRADMRGAAQWLHEQAAPDDMFVADEHALLHLYLAASPGWEEVWAAEEILRPDQLETLALTRHDVWVVLKQNRMADAYPPAFLDWLRAHFEPAATVGAAPPPLVRHDNRLVVLRRRERGAEDG